MAKIKVLDLTLGVIAAVVLLGAGFGWYQLHQNNQGLETKLAQQKQELRQIIAKIQEYRENSARTQEIKDEIKRLAVFFPDKEGQAEFVYELERMASAAGLEINSCKLQKDSKKLKSYPKYSIYQWQVEFSGSYEALLAFLKGLPNSKRFVNAVEMKVNSVQDETKGQFLNISCTLDLMTTSAPEKVK